MNVHRIIFHCFVSLTWHRVRLLSARHLPVTQHGLWPAQMWSFRVRNSLGRYQRPRAHRALVWETCASLWCGCTVQAGDECSKGHFLVCHIQVNAQNLSNKGQEVFHCKQGSFFDIGCSKPVKPPPLQYHPMYTKLQMSFVVVQSCLTVCNPMDCSTSLPLIREAHTWQT